MTKDCAVGRADPGSVDAASYGRDLRVRAALLDGTPVCVRGIRPDDKQRLLAGFERLSAQSVYHRFFEALKTLSAGDLRQLTELDFRERVGLVMTLDGEEGETLIGVARYAKEAVGADRAEVGIVVADEYQNRGAGTLLLEQLVAVARAAGIRELVALVLDDNEPMLDLLRRSELPLVREYEHGVYRFVLNLEPRTTGHAGPAAST